MRELCPWATGTGPDQPGLASQVCGPKTQEQSGPDCGTGQGLERGHSMTCALLLGSGLAPVWGQVESTGVEPLLCDKETLDSEVLMARV